MNWFDSSCKRNVGVGESGSGGLLLWNHTRLDILIFLSEIKFLRKLRLIGFVEIPLNDYRNYFK